MQLVSIADIRAAAEGLAGVALRTPLVPAPWAGEDFWLKPESLQPIGSFKLRGGYHAVASLPLERRAAGVVAHSSGNHGQAVAYAARAFGARCVIVVPRNANPGKLAAMRSLGAELVEHGRDFDEARNHCEELHAREGYRYVHSANEPDLIAGVGTYALELFDELPDPDVILVPVGLGSGVAVIVGGLFLLYRGVIDFRIPALVIATAFIAMLVLPIPTVITETGANWRWLALRETDVRWETAVTFVNYEMMASPILFVAFFLAWSGLFR